jgi:response regulator NasT
MPSSRDFGDAPRKKRILVADDDRLTLAQIVLIVERAGHEALAASSGLDALKLAEECDPDLAILDISMPDVSGIDVARALRSRSAIPIVFLSSHRDDVFYRQASESGALAYFVKPAVPAQLTMTIQAALDNTDEIRRLRENEERLISALASSREINTAIGVLMERRRVTRHEAFEMLRAHARAQRRKLDQVAAEVLAAEHAINDYPPTQHSTGRPQQSERDERGTRAKKTRR